ncbi:hypothetical protein [Marinicrinis lubricantis]|uniref:Uncharacterized protein n=1 Tax=Marinicrinis lubricantis TaxID=2086470 RepID=A0ABW1IKG0_9BACL
MLHSSRRKVISGILSFILICALILPVTSITADTGSTATAAKTTSLGKVMINSKSYFELDQILEIPSNQNKVVAFTFTVHNKEQKELSFIDYWVKLTTKSGTAFMVKLVESDKNKNSISSLSTQTYTYYAVVNNNVKITDLMVKFIEWDFSQPSYEKVLGTISVPANYTYITKAGEAASIVNSGANLNIGVVRSTFGQGDQYTSTNLQIALTNTGTKTTTIPELTYYIKTKNNTLYQLNAVGIPEDKMLQPLDELKFNLTGNIPAEVSLDGWSLVVAKKDGEVELPAAYLGLNTKNVGEVTVPENEAKTIQVGNVDVEVVVEDVFTFERNNEHQIKWELTFTNKGNVAVTLPNYEFEVSTADGLKYPSSSTLKDLSINPKASKTIEGAAAIPDDVNVDSNQLVIKEAADKGGYTIAVFKLAKPVTGGSDSYTKGQTYEFSNEDGKYGVTLTSIQKLPWDDMDIIAAEIKVENKDTVSLPMPDLTGQFNLDGVALDANGTEWMLLDQMLGIPVGKAANYIVYTKVPYTYQYSTIELDVKEKLTEEDALDLATFAHASTNFDLPTVSADESFTIDAVGKQANIKVRKLKTYTASSTKILELEVEVENAEKRQTELAELVGYLKTEDDQYFKLSQSKVEQSISAGGKALISFWTVVPYSYTTEGLELVVGQLIGGEEAQGYMQAGVLELPYETGINPKKDFTNIEVYPYTFNVNSAKIVVHSSGVRIDFNYELTKDRLYEVAPDGHQLIIELVDGDNKYTQTYEFEKDLLVGTNNGTFNASMNIGDLLSKLMELEGFEVNIYDQYQGHKKLVASKYFTQFYSE